MLTAPDEFVRLMLEHREPAGSFPNDGGAHDRIRQHPWLKSMNWEQLASRMLTPPFRPDVSRANCNTGHDDASDALLGSAEDDLVSPNLSKDQRSRLLTYEFNTGQGEAEKRAGAEEDNNAGMRPNKYKTASISPL